MGADSRLAYEAQLDEIFWNPNGSGITCIVGPAASGKSILVDYYLGYNCPRRFVSEFPRMLVISFDASGVGSVSEFFSIFYSRARQSISERCATLGLKIDAKIDSIDSDQRWVDSVLPMLPRSPEQYFVLALDHLDSCPSDVQLEALGLVRKWAHEMRTWEIYIPLRPDTYARLLEECNPFPQHETLQFGTSYSESGRLLYAAPELETFQPALVRDFSEVNDEMMAYFAKRPDELHALPWRKFEELLDCVFRNQGFTSELGPGSGDGGVDLRLVRKDTIGEVLTLVQAKCYNPKRPIGLEPVAALSAVIDQEGAHRGLLVTTSRFLPGARDFAHKHQQRLELATAKEVALWCEEITRRKIDQAMDK